MAGYRVNRRVAVVVVLVVVALLLFQLFRYGPVSKSDEVQDKNNAPKSVLRDEADSIQQEPDKDKTPQIKHQNRLLDTPNKTFEDSKHVPSSDDKKRHSQNHPQSNKAVLRNVHISNNSDTSRHLHQKSNVDGTNFGHRSQLHNPRKSSNISPIYHGLNASSAFDHFSNKSTIKSSTRPTAPVDRSDNVPLQHVVSQTETAGSTKDTCSSFYEEVVNPTFQPIPVCGSKDYPMHTVHCYQSTINVNQYQDLRSLNETTMRSSDVDVGMGVTCTFQNIAVNGQNVMKTLRDCARNCDVRSSKSLFLLDGKQSQCPIPTISLLMNKTDQHDYTRNFVQELLMLNVKKQLDPSQCGQWVNKTALFFIANEPYNVYFQFLTYYNVFLTMTLLSSTKLDTFKGLMSFRNDPQEFVLVRLSDTTDYKFRDFERNLFPQLKVLSQLGNLANDSGNERNDITCFQRVVKVPWAYSAFPFRSVVDSTLKNKALRCYNTVQNTARIHTRPKQRQRVGKYSNLLSRQRQTGVDQRDQNINYRELRYAASSERSQTVTVVPSMIVFQSLVLKACGIEERIDQNELRSQAQDDLKVSPPRDKAMHIVRQKFPLQVIMIKRKPYLRHGLDHPNLFQRILSNEAELITALMQNTSRGLLNVTSVYMEELDICDQVKVAHKADILIGVHGAGLVHSWWMKEGGVLLELVPVAKLDRRTYKILAGLTGRKYYSVILENSPQKHQSHISISAVLELIDKITKDYLIN